jgi:predicted secreted protein
MRLNVVQAASARLAASLGFLVLAAAPALAGDAAAIDPIGFSSDGRFFAYEEYGIQDGSGFPYDSIFLVDLIEDKWVGMPVRVRLEDDTATLDAARQKALAEARPMLEKAALTVPAQPLLMNADGESGDSGIEASFGMFGNGLTPPTDPFTLKLETFASTSSAPCASYGMEEPVKGFALTLADSAGNAAEIYRDSAVPASRGCVSDYRIHAVLSPFPFGFSASPLVAVISVYSLGFEGPDRRFVTVPVAP